MLWFKRKPEKPLREQLLEARANLVRQIEVTEAGPVRFEPGDAEYYQNQTTVLKATLQEIDRALAETGNGKAQT